MHGRSFCVADTITLSRGQTLYHEQDPALGWYEVYVGMVRTCRYHRDGSRQIIGFFHSRDAFGVDRGFYRASAEAVTDAIVRRHPYTDLDDQVGITHADPFLLRALERADECIQLLGRRSATARLASFLVRLHERSAHGAELSLDMPREDIADHLGLTVETVSRTFSELAKRKAIALRKAHLVTIIDMAVIHQLAGEECHPTVPGERRRQMS